MESHNTNPLETLAASVSKKKKKTLSTSRLSPNSKRKEKPRKRKKNKRRKERRKERKERRTVERSSRGASSRRGESRESIGMRGNFKSPSLFSLQVLASVPKLSSVDVQLFDRTRDTTKHILTRNSPLFISMAD